MTIMAFRLRHPAKALSPINITISSLDENSTDVRARQLANANASMFSISCGKFMDRRPVQRANAPDPMCFTLSGSFMDSSFVQ